jgi:hypothetical protein
METAVVVLAMILCIGCMAMMGGMAIKGLRRFFGRDDH